MVSSTSEKFQQHLTHRSIMKKRTEEIKLICDIFRFEFLIKSSVFSTERNYSVALLAVTNYIWNATETMWMVSVFSFIVRILLMTMTGKSTLTVEIPKTMSSKIKTKTESNPIILKIAIKTNTQHFYPQSWTDLMTWNVASAYISDARTVARAWPSNWEWCSCFICTTHPSRLRSFSQYLRLEHDVSQIARLLTCHPVIVNWRWQWWYTIFYPVIISMSQQSNGHCTGETFWTEYSVFQFQKRSTIFFFASSLLQFAKNNSDICFICRPRTVAFD